jgi:hypothetical protein
MGMFTHPRDIHCSKFSSLLQKQDLLPPEAVVENPWTSSTRKFCNVVCSKAAAALTCYAGGEGEDRAICFASQYILCKDGCLGIKKCVRKCEKVIVEPCVQVSFLLSLVQREKKSFRN